VRERGIEREREREGRSEGERERERNSRLVNLRGPGGKGDAFGIQGHIRGNTWEAMREYCSAPDRSRRR